MSEGTVKVLIGGAARVLSKYARVIEHMNKSSGMFQEVADAWVAMIRQMAVDSGLEVDDLLAKIEAEAAEEEAQAKPRGGPADAG